MPSHCAECNREDCFPGQLKQILRSYSSPFPVYSRSLHWCCTSLLFKVDRERGPIFATAAKAYCLISSRKRDAVLINGRKKDGGCGSSSLDNHSSSIN